MNDLAFAIVSIFVGLYLSLRDVKPIQNDSYTLRFQYQRFDFKSNRCLCVDTSFLIHSILSSLSSVAFLATTSKYDSICSVVSPLKSPLEISKSLNYST